MTWDSEEPYAVIHVTGIPVPQGSLTAFLNPNPARSLLQRRMPIESLLKALQACVIMPQSRKVKAWRRQVAEEAEAMQYRRPVFVESGPIKLALGFVMPRLKSTRKYDPPSDAALAAKQPDLDKLTRAIGDALEGIWYGNDSQIVDLVVRKRVAPSLDHEPGVTISMFRVE